MEFGSRLGALRRERGLSLRALATRIHYSGSYLHDIEHGRKPPTPDLAAALDEALDAHGSLIGRAHV